MARVTRDTFLLWRRKKKVVYVTPSKLFVPAKRFEEPLSRNDPIKGAGIWRRIPPGGNGDGLYLTATALLEGRRERPEQSTSQFHCSLGDHSGQSHPISGERKTMIPTSRSQGIYWPDRKRERKKGPRSSNIQLILLLFYRVTNVRLVIIFRWKIPKARRQTRKLLSWMTSSTIQLETKSVECYKTNTFLVYTQPL